MKTEVLCATMGQSDFSLSERLNLKTDAVIINQCEKNEYSEQNGKIKVRMYSFAERGIGISRNSALVRATGDYLLFADDDITYVDGYEALVTDGFARHPDADMLIFNYESSNLDRPEYTIISERRVHIFNCLRYGAVRIAVKREFLYRKNIWFSVLFGGGAKYNSGEDTIFIADCFKNGARVYSVPQTLCSVSYEKSSWFCGFDEKYFHDVGVTMSAIFGKAAYLLVLPLILKKRSVIEMPLSRAVRNAFCGIHGWLKGATDN